MASCFRYSSSEDEDGLDSVIGALYAEVIARQECGAEEEVWLFFSNNSCLSRAPLPD